MGTDISVHQLRIFQFVREAKGWVTAREIAEGASVNPRTARAHALAFAKAGVFQFASIFPGHRYAFAPDAKRKNKDLLERLAQAERAIGT